MNFYFNWITNKFKWIRIKSNRFKKIQKSLLILITPIFTLLGLFQFLFYVMYNRTNTIYPLSVGRPSIINAYFAWSQRVTKHFLLHLSTEMIVFDQDNNLYGFLKQIFTIRNINVTLQKRNKETFRKRFLCNFLKTLQ